LAVALADRNRRVKLALQGMTADELAEVTPAAVLGPFVYPVLNQLVQEVLGGPNLSPVPAYLLVRSPAQRQPDVDLFIWFCRFVRGEAVVLESASAAVVSPCAAAGSSLASLSLGGASGSAATGSASVSLAPPPPADLDAQLVHRNNMVRAHVRGLNTGEVQIARALYESEDMCVAFINSLLPSLLPVDPRRPGSVSDALCLEVGSRRLLDTELVRWVHQYLQMDPPAAGAAAAAHP
jgi:hypothetical protein